MKKLKDYQFKDIEELLPYHRVCRNVVIFDKDSYNYLIAHIKMVRYVKQQIEERYA